MFLTFPHMDLIKIVKRWVIPVLPGGELEVLLEHSIDLCRWNVVLSKQLK